MKSSYFLIGGAALLAACGGNGVGSAAGDSTFTIKGSVKGLDSGWVILSRSLDGEKEIRDSAKVSNGAFTLTGSTAEPTQAYLGVRNGDYGNVAMFYLDNAPITLTANKDSLMNADIKGGTAQTEYLEYKNTTKAFEDKMRALGTAYQAAGDNKVVQDSIRKVAEGMEGEQRASARKYIAGHPKSFVAANEVLNMYSYNPNVPEFDSTYSGLDSSIKNSLVGKRIAAQLAMAKKTDIGQVAPELTLNDVTGKQQTLSSHKGKYVLVDFWASWCGPCRAENPNVVKAYNAYKNKGFDIVGVSLDEDKDAWQKAIVTDHLAWTQLSDLKGWKSDAASTYGIRGIPMNYLLDKDGKIVAKGLRGDELEGKLAELLK